MRTLLKLIVVTSILFSAVTGYAETQHGHDHDAPIGGPKGGRLLEGTEPHAEFFVEKDRTVTVTFYDEELKPVALTEQSVSVTAKTAGKKVTLDFEKSGDVLVSKGSLPEDHEINLVVRLKQAPNGRTQNFRFAYEDHVCDGCKRAEYACICAH